MATDPPSSSSLASASSTAAADSYIGSLISLTSKSEIRYEGVLVVLDTKESTIALQNVRSYGTEDRKKDGPQIPPSEKVYGYILFRGSDIKDLQVKSSPPSLPKSELYNDPVIIQSQSSFEPSSTTSVLGGRTLTVSNSNSGEASLTRPNFSYSLPSYNSTEGSVPAPQHSLSTYQTGYYGGSSSTNNSQQQFPAFQAASLVPPPTLQNQLQNSVASAQLNLSLPANTRNADPMAAPTSVHHSQFVSSNSAEAVPFFSHESHNSSQSSMMAAELFMKSPFVPNQESHFLHDKDPTSFGGPPVSVLPTPSFSQSTSNIVSSSSPLLTASSSLLTPDQLKPSALSSSTQKFFPEMKESAALLPIPPNPQSSIPAMPQAPLLPLPVSSQEQQQSATQFNDEFDFSAMNEKFNKDEVWGSLGKAKQRGGVGDRTQELDRNTEQRASADSTSICDRKPVYNKDDFFDTLSSNSINQEAWNRRSKFSERVKHDTETFGEFQQWPPSGRGNSWGPRPGGNFRGSYNRGRGGYGYYGGLGRRGYSPS